MRPLSPAPSVALRRSPLLALGLVVAFATGCRPHESQMTATQSDVWTRSYVLAEGGLVEIANRNGRIEVRGADGQAVEIQADRRVTATSDQVARDVLAALEIKETVEPAKVVINTEGVDGLLLGASWEIHYRVTVPRSASVRVRTSNGAIDVQDVGGRLTASASNGEITAMQLRGGVDVRSINGRVRVGIDALSESPVSVRSTNGAIDVVMPSAASALVDATVMNGRIEVTGFTLDPIGEQTRRRVRGRLNEGRTPVDLNIVNGNIRLSNTAAPAAP